MDTEHNTQCCRTKEFPIFRFSSRFGANNFGCLLIFSSSSVIPQLAMAWMASRATRDKTGRVREEEADPRDTLINIFLRCHCQQEELLQINNMLPVSGVGELHIYAEQKRLWNSFSSAACLWSK